MQPGQASMSRRGAPSGAWSATPGGGARRGVAASEGGRARGLGKMPQLLPAVVAGPEAGVAAAATGAGRPAAAVLLRTLGGDDRELRIPGPDRLLRCLSLEHRRL